MVVEKLAVSLCLYKRERNWKDIIPGLVKAAKGVEDKVEICFWNNWHESTFELPDDYPLKTHIINSSNNYICLPRYFMPLIVVGEKGAQAPSNFLFLDDDVVPTEGLFASLIDSYEKIGDKNALIGARGGILGEKFGGVRYEGGRIPVTEVDYLAGQSLMGSTHLLVAMIQEPVPDWCDHAEDLWFMYLTQKHFGSQKFVVPTPGITRHSKRKVSLTDTDRQPAYEKLRSMGFKILVDNSEDNG